MGLLAAFDRWKPRHLLASWAVYWTGLAAATLGPAAVHVLRLRDGPENTSSVAADVTNGIATLTVVENGVTTWTGSGSLMTIMLLVAIPPLVLWGLWVLRRPRRDAALPAADARAAVGPGAFEPVSRPGARDASPIERDRDA